MPPRQDYQLAFEFTRDRAPTGIFSATRPLRRHRRYRYVLERLCYVRRFFPELGNQVIRVGLTRAASGMAVPGGHEIWLNPNQISHHTIAHEFMHLLQGEYGIPTGERSCDLFSLARHWTLNDTRPYYVRTPAEFLDISGKIRPRHARVICSVARDAIERRVGGRRDYIAYFENALERLSVQPLLAERVALFGPVHEVRDESASRLPKAKSV